MAERDVCVFFLALALALGTFFSFRPSPELSIGDVDRAAEVGVRRAAGSCVGVVRGKARGSYPLVIFLVPSLELSVGDVETPSLAARRVGGIVHGAAYTGRSLSMSPDLSVREVGKAAVGARLARELSVGGVERRALCDDAPSMWLPLQLSVRSANSGAG